MSLYKSDEKTIRTLIEEKLTKNMNWQLQKMKCE